MKITNVAKEGSKASVTFELSAATLEAAKAVAYNKAKKSIQLPGFRKGHAPRKMVEAMYGADVFLEDAIDELLPKMLDAMTQEGLKVVGVPSITDTEKLEEGARSLTMDVPVYPEVKLGQYQGIEAPKAEASVTEEEIQQELQKMQQNVARVETVERPAQMGDTANIDFEGFVDGVAFEGGKGEAFDLKLGSGSFIPGIEEQVAGMSAGEEKDLDVTFPEDYQADLAGKAAVFHVKLNSVKEEQLPEMDDEFVKDVSEFDTMDELRKDIEARLLKEKNDEIQNAFRNAVIDLAVDGMEADIPDCMVDEELRYQLRQTEYQLSMSGMDMAQYAELFGGEAKMREIMRPSALRQVQRQVLLAAVAEAEKLEASDEEVEAEYQRLAEAYGMELADVKSRMPAEDCKTDLLAKKAQELIVNSAVAAAPVEEKTEE